tara:strand:- start:2067 stop:2396 length:330 start_codon:yes stop_codon:yes gene_type:complete
MVWLWEWMCLFTGLHGLESPMMLSGARTEAEQQWLRKCWDLDMGFGLSYRPALDSKHIPDEHSMVYAFDVANAEEWCLNIGLHVSKNFVNYEWGGEWDRPDVRHFEERG